MRKQSSKKRTTIEKYRILPAERTEILWKSVSTAGGDYDYYDIRYGGIIITGCSIREGKNGSFLAAPSHKIDETYVRDIYFTDEFNDQIIGFIEDADEKNKWKQMSDDYYLKVRE